MRFWGTIVIAALVTLVTSAQNTTERTPNSIKATVVAVDTFWPLLECYHVCGISLIVRIDGPESRYAKVHISYMDDRHSKDKGPQVKLIEQSLRWKFEVTRNDPPSLLLERYWNDKSEPLIEAWRKLKGAENESLPFGEMIVSYSVDVGKYWVIK